MFRPSAIIIDAFIKQLLADYTEMFGRGPRGHRDTISQVARMTLPRIARSNAIYHNLDHTIQCTLVGQDILRGRMVRDGDVLSSDWVEFVTSLLSFAIGFARGVCPGDDGDRCVIDGEGHTITLPRGATDGRLWPHFTDRSKIFIRHYFRGHPMLSWEVLVANVEYSRFPPPESTNLETASYPGLLRAAHVIGTVADPNFALKLRPLLIELTESNMFRTLGFAHVGEFFTQYPDFFWRALSPLIPEGVDLLKYTGDGRTWLANMHHHILMSERPRAD